MDSSANLAKLSAYTRVCQTFVSACEKESVDPVDCLQAISRMLDIPRSTTPSQLAPPPKPKTVQLSKAQVGEAKQLARSVKAKKFGVSASEVNLTSEEAKEAKARFRDLVYQGKDPKKSWGNDLPVQPGNPSPQNPSNSKNSGPPQTSPLKSVLPSQQGSVPQATQQRTYVNPTGKGQVDKPDPQTAKKQVGIQLDKTGSRATAKTKVDNCRKNCLRQFPLAMDEPTVLHLMAYANHRNRLARQWEEYQKTYEYSGILDPLRGLPDPWKQPKTSEKLRYIVATLGLREQFDSPGTYILQSEDGGSFWDRDMPSALCPEILKAPLGHEILHELSPSN